MWYWDDTADMLLSFLVLVEKIMAKTLIQGSSRGIGLEFCRMILSRSVNVRVIATCRTPDKAYELQDLRSKSSDRLQILPLDVTRETDIKSTAALVEKEYGGLDLLINSAGMLHPSGRGETSLKEVTFQGLQDTFATNTFGPLLMAKYFGGLLQKGTGYFGADCTHCGVLVNMSAKVGSITDNALGGWYSYRMSKSALNMVTKNLSIELGRGKQKVICVSLHPGTVDTTLSRPYHKNVKKLFSTEQSVTKLLNVIDSLKLEDSGKFFTYDKELLPF